MIKFKLGSKIYNLQNVYLPLLPGEFPDTHVYDGLRGGSITGEY
jgi:hypothetical protein